MTALEAVGLRAGYGHVEAVHDVSLRVDAGEVVALLGANGAGKTTTVRAIAGLLPAAAGSISLRGEDVTALPTHLRARRGLGVVTDGRLLCQTMTVAENLRVAMTGADQRGEVGSWLPQVGGLLDQRAGTLSGGEQRIVALARALVAGPGVIVVDELSAGLAPALAATAMAALRRAASEWGTGVLIVEQATKLALEAADRAIVLTRGRVAAEGSAAELVRRPEIVESAYLGRL